MNRCRRTDAIADIVADPALGADALTEEQRRHVSVCADCFATVADLERLDAALTAGLRSRPREELPVSILATPALPRSRREGPSPMAFLAAAAVVVLAVGLTFAGARLVDLRQIGVGPTDPSVSAEPTPAASQPAPSLAPAPSSTSAPSATPVPAPVSLEVGAIAAVVDEPLVVRVAPGTDPDTTMTDERLWVGQRVRILDGPAHSDGYTWWEVQVGEIRGWVADAERDGSKPWLSPIANGRIYFWRYPGEGDVVLAPTLFSIGVDGSDERELGLPAQTGGLRLVISCGTSSAPIEWTHDGSWGAFEHSEGGCDRQVWTMRPDGSDMRVVADGWAPAWRPDGTTLAFAPNGLYLQVPELGAGEIMTVGLDDAAPRQLTDTGERMTAGFPSWAPDRQRIAFSAGVPSGNDFAVWDYRIYVSNADGTGARVIADGMRPLWSPDGRWIVFEVHDPDRESTELWRVPSDGGDATLLGEGRMAEFSPDGSRLAVVRDGGVWTMASDGGEPSLAIPATNVDGLAWSQDGTSLVVSSNYASETAVGVSVVRLDGQAPAITELVAAGHAPSWQPVLLDPRLGE